MKSRLTLSAVVLAATLCALVWLAAASPHTEGSGRPEPAGDVGMPRMPSCWLPLVMGDTWGRDAVTPNPRDDINAADAQWILAKVAGFHLPQGGRGCSPEDIDCDGDRDTVDALWILRWVAELPYHQVEPCPDIGTEVPHM